jgi:hypothetical protein
VNGDGRIDWLVGQTTFFAPGPDKKDVVVQEWCMNIGNGGDFYSVRVYTSSGGKETLALPITERDPFEFCPFGKGQNSGVTLPNGTPLQDLPDSALTTLPTRLDWISITQTPNKYKGQKTFIWILPNGAVVAGQIRIPKDATSDAKVPPDAFGSVLDSPANKYVPLTGPQKAVTAIELTPQQKLGLYQAAWKEYTSELAKGGPATPC